MFVFSKISHHEKNLWTWRNHFQVLTTLCCFYIYLGYISSNVNVIAQRCLESSAEELLIFEIWSVLNSYICSPAVVREKTHAISSCFLTKPWLEICLKQLERHGSGCLFWSTLVLWSKTQRFVQFLDCIVAVSNVFWSLVMSFWKGIQKDCDLFNYSASGFLLLSYKLYRCSV